jgi:hypothetical protein
MNNNGFVVGGIIFAATMVSTATVMLFDKKAKQETENLKEILAMAEENNARLENLVNETHRFNEMTDKKLEETGKRLKNLGVIG